MSGFRTSQPATQHRPAQRRQRNERRIWITLIVGLALLAVPVLSPAFAQENPCGESVIITEGDTLSAIALRCNTTVDALLNANPEVDPRALQIGSELIIPTGDDDPGLERPKEPVVAVAPLPDSPATNVEVFATGFPDGATLRFGVAVPGTEYNFLETVEDTPYGAAQVNLVLPDEFAAEDNWQIIVTTEADEVETISTLQEPVVAIAPVAGSPGSTIDLILNDFPAGALVELGVGRWRSEYDVVRSLYTGSTGTLRAQVILPAFAAPTEQWVVVATTSDAQIEAISAVFTVTEATDTPDDDPAAPPDDAPGDAPGDGDDVPAFTSANVYLIALEDGGESGMEVGCGDSAIPVEVSFAPTSAPLTAALETLFAMDERMVGQSGLYNALYQSDLTVDGIDIEDGTATINLSGTLREGGTCDAPRIDAQIRQTALQFDTIERVVINLNGAPL